MFSSRTGALLLLLLLPAGAWADKLRLVGDIWPPYTDQSLPHGGLAVELVSTALERAGYASEYMEMPWARALHGIGNGSYDVLVCAWHSREREAIGAFSTPYLTNRILFLQRKDNPVRYRRLDDLLALDIAVVRGYAYEHHFDSHERLRKVPVLGFDNALHMLYAGRVALALDDERVARFRLSRESPRLREALEFLPRPLSENPLHILVSRHRTDHARIVAAFDRALAGMRADGTYAKLLRAWERDGDSGLRTTARP